MVKKYINRTYENSYGWITGVQMRQSMKDMTITQWDKHDKKTPKRLIVLNENEFGWLRQAVHDFEAEGELTSYPSAERKD